ncbi:MAG TPA: hypothetical protein VHG08_09825 [Longimicrobium sp.]|nr:hypothetical protein [Longimicrobium sp.]
MNPPLPALEVVPLERCLLHEETDPGRVERLTRRLCAERVLRNPPVVASQPGRRSLMVLDGSTRITALRALGLRHVVAQVVEYADERIQVQTWNHVVPNATLDRLAARLSRESRLRPRDCVRDEAEELLARRETLAYLTDASARCLAVGAARGLRAQARALCRLFAIYAARARVVRVPLGVWTAPARRSKAAQTAVVFPRFTKEELIALARARTPLPAGITRHVIPGRILRLNLPLERLSSPEPLREHRRWLRRWLKDQLHDHRVRYYEEPTFVFDE